MDGRVRGASRLLFTLCLLGGAVGCPAPTEPSGPYRLTVLEGFGTSSSPSYNGITFKSYAYALDPSGRAVGMAENADARESLRGAIWSDEGAPSALDANGIVLEVAYGINARGQIVGKGRCGDMGTACIWDEGQLRTLGTLDYDGFSTPLAINNRGEAVGWAEASPAGFDHAVLWRDGEAIDLGTLGGLQSQALDIDDSSRVVGWARPPDVLSRHAFIWKDGVMTDLGTLGGEESAAHAINDSGQVVGWIGGVGAFSRQGFIWQRGTMNVLPGSGPSQAFGINNHGDVVGTCTPPSETGTTLHAALWRNDVRYDLNELAGNARMTLMWANAINDQGQIVGIGRWKDRGEREFAFLLTLTGTLP
jgi:probable HAF family extracellular repeat protein